MELTEGQVVGSSEWAEGAAGRVTRLNDSGAAIEVYEPAPKVFTKYVWRNEWWPRTDWPLLIDTSATPESILVAAEAARANQIRSMEAL